MSMWGKYGKSIVAAIYAVAVGAIPMWTGDRHIDASEGILIAVAIGNALLVYIVPLKPEFKSVKSVVNAVMAALSVALAQIAGGLDINDTLMVAAALLSALGVTLAPAASTKGNTPVAVGPGLDT